MPWPLVAPYVRCHFKRANYKLVQTNTGWQYTLAYLNPGDYTVAATCEGDTDAPGVDDAIAFVGTRSVTVYPDTEMVSDIVP